jgi:hypothetical protein
LFCAYICNPDRAAQKWSTLNHIKSKWKWTIQQRCFGDLL